MEKENSIYCMYYQKGAFYNVEGKKIGELGDVPVNPRAASVVYDATVTKVKAWIWDVAFDEYENPVVVFAKFPDDSNHVYTWSKWNSGKWISHDLTNSGGWFPSDPLRERNYSGGVVLDHENPDIVYLSSKSGGKYGIRVMERLNDNHWNVGLPGKSERDHVRPVAVRNAQAGNPLQYLWMENTKYVHYTDYLSGIRMRISE
jgi:hypothetical protein